MLSSKAFTGHVMVTLIAVTPGRGTRSAMGGRSESDAEVCATRV